MPRSSAAPDAPATKKKPARTRAGRTAKTAKTAETARRAPRPAPKPAPEQPEWLGEGAVVVDAGPDPEPGPEPDPETAPVRGRRDLVVSAADRQDEARRQSRRPARQRDYQVERVPIDWLLPAEYNPRIMPLGEDEALGESLETFGQVESIVVNTYPGREGIIVGGHQRVRKQRELGWTEAKVCWVYETPAREIKLNLALNRIGGDWDEPKLAKLIVDLDEEEGGTADLAMTGFTDEELGGLRDLAAAGDAADVAGGGVEDDYDPDQEPPAPRRVRLGDLWAIGPHRLVCGDAGDDLAVHLLLGDRLADCVFTSPPYNVGVGYRDHDDQTQTWEQYRSFLMRVLQATAPHVDRGRAVCWNIGSIAKTFPYRQFALLEQVGLDYYRTVIWQKVGVPLPMWHNTRDHPFARNFQPNYTFEFVGIFATGPLRRGPRVAFDDMLQHDVFMLHQSTATSDLPEDRSGAVTGANSNLETRKRAAHPAAFPVGVPAAFLQYLTAPGEAVYEPFCGSGSTLVACEKLGRVGYGMELSPTYCDGILARLEGKHGLTAELLHREG